MLTVVVSRPSRLSPLFLRRVGWIILTNLSAIAHYGYHHRPRTRLSSRSPLDSNDDTGSGRDSASVTVYSGSGSDWDW